LVLFSLFAWAPLLYPGYLQVHSGFLPIFTLADLSSASDKLHWLPAATAGGGLLRGEGPLAYWLALLLRSFAGDLGAVKGIFALSILAGGLGVAAWTRRAFAGWGEPAGRSLAEGGASEGGRKARPYTGNDVVGRSALLAAVVFMLWPPLLMTVYVRGALAEVVFLGILPWALVGVSGIRCRASGARAWTGIAGTALAVACLYWAQAGLAFWATALLAMWAVWPGSPGRTRGAALGAVLAGAALGLGVLWLLQGGITSGQPGDLAAHAVYPYQLFSPAWSFGVSTPDWKGDLPLTLGLAAVSLAMLTVVLGSAPSQPRPTPSSAGPRGGFWQSALGFSLIAGLTLILLTTTAARPLWAAVPALAATLTYPWQLFALVGPLLALLAGSVLIVERRLALLPSLAGLLAFVVLSSAAAMTPRFTQVDPGPAPAGVFGADQVTLLTATASFAPDSAVSGDESSTLQPSISTPLTVTLAWQTLEPVNLDYNLFVHALDGAGNKLAQWDGQPPRGRESYPTSQWQVGEIVPSTIRLELSPEQAAAIRQVAVGLYDWQTGARLSTGSDDKVIITPSPAPGDEVSP
jgi:hypothetical protein